MAGAPSRVASRLASAVNVPVVDFWRAIVRAFDAGEPDAPDFAALPNFDLPAASRYAATNQTLLKWFDPYNQTVAPKERVAPFNFLLSYQTKSALELAAMDPEQRFARPPRPPAPASRYSSNLIKDPPPVFDRRTGQPVPWNELKTYARTLVRHHLHAESKFRGGEDNERGHLRRRRSRRHELDGRGAADIARRVLHVQVVGAAQAKHDRDHRGPAAKYPLPHRVVTAYKRE